MADQTQLDLLKAGVEGWNAWREANLEVEVDLGDADLRDANLSRANLSRANLSRAILSDANLRYANLDRVKPDINTLMEQGANLR